MTTLRRLLTDKFLAITVGCRIWIWVFDPMSKPRHECKMLKRSEISTGELTERTKLIQTQCWLWNGGQPSTVALSLLVVLLYFDALHFSCLGCLLLVFVLN